MKVGCGSMGMKAAMCEDRRGCWRWMCNERWLDNEMVGVNVRGGDRCDRCEDDDGDAKGAQAALKWWLAECGLAGGGIWSLWVE
ncbi:hypothetical protein Tco_0044376 [Tanacetum coccineum]